MSNVPMTRPAEVLAVHGPSDYLPMSFVELDGGRILGVKGDRFTTSDDGGLTWSETFQCTDKSGGQVSGNALVQLSGRGIGLSGSIGEDSRALVFWRSEDQGETWEAPDRVTEPGYDIAHTYKDMLLRTSSGRIVLPTYLGLGKGAGAYLNPGSVAGPGDETQPGVGKLVNGHWINSHGHWFDPRFSCVSVYYSDDEGRTWQRNSDGELIILLDWNAKYSYVNEPTVTEVEPGTLLMFMRSGLGRIFQAWSYNDGETWTRPQPTSLAASTTPANINTLPNGHLLVVWNQHSEEEITQGHVRTRLSSAVSRNGGSVWEFFQNIESLHEETRLEPGPIGRKGPAEYHFQPGKAAPERDAAGVTPTTNYGRWTYPSVLVMKDRVIVAYWYIEQEEHPTKAVTDLVSRDKMKVLPMTWFYGGQEPADNPYLST